MKKVVILGNFDGLHIGHQKLIKEAIHYAKEHNFECIIYTFSTLPNNKKYIMTTEEKLEALKSTGVDDVYIDNFFNIKNYTANEFVNEILINKLNAEVVFCGYNFTFAINKSGDVNLLKKLIKTYVVNEIKIDNYKISSSIIREYILRGEIEKANKLLNRNFEISGYIIHGKKIGRTIGFPTANIKPNSLKIMPPLGVYGVKVKIEGFDSEFVGIMNIGKNPTVNNDGYINIETNIFNFNQDIYGKKIKIFVYKLIRLEKKFESLNELAKQIKSDVSYWENIYDKY